MSETQISFTKMNGLGNNFVVFDARRESVVLADSEVRRLANSIHFDQMITIENTKSDANAFMRIVNADGAEVEACGNATRCIGRLIMEEEDSEHVRIETRAGILEAFATGKTERVSVDMGEPRLMWNEIPLSREFQDTAAIELEFVANNETVLSSPSVVNVGNPHAIFWVEDLNRYDLSRYGPELENHAMFPEKANISIAEVTGPNAIRLIVWERGVGLTKACGTAACAASVAGIRRKIGQLSGRKNTVYLPGGPLETEWRESDNHVLMTGDTEFEFKGVLDSKTAEWKILETLN